MNAPLPAPKLHPALLAAALSVSALALAGIGALTGAVPFATRSAELAPAAAVAAPATAAAQIAAPVTRPKAAAASTAPSTAPHAPAEGFRRTSASTTVPSATTSHEPLAIEVTGKPTTESTKPAVSPEPATLTAATLPDTPRAAACRDCGVIESVGEIVKEGEGTGIGVVGGAVVGGLVGSLIGKGRGNDAAKVLGAIGGGYAGHQIEKNVRKETRYEVVVRFEDGTTRRLTQETAPTWRQGDRVKMVNGVLTAS